MRSKGPSRREPQTISGASCSRAAAASSWISPPRRSCGWRSVRPLAANHSAKRLTGALWVLGAVGGEFFAGPVDVGVVLGDGDDADGEHVAAEPLAEGDGEGAGAEGGLAWGDGDDDRAGADRLDVEIRGDDEGGHREGAEEASGD